MKFTPISEQKSKEILYAVFASPHSIAGIARKYNLPYSSFYNWLTRRTGAECRNHEEFRKAIKETLGIEV